MFWTLFLQIRGFEDKARGLLGMWQKEFVFQNHLKNDSLNLKLKMGPQPEFFDST